MWVVYFCLDVFRFNHKKMATIVRQLEYGMISKKVTKIPYYHVFFLKIVKKWLKKIMWVGWFLYYFLNPFVEKCSLMYRNLRYNFFQKRKQNHPTLMDFLKEIIKNVKEKIMWPVCFAHSIFKVYKKISSSEYGKFALNCFKKLL